jgi:hypothetical protein
MNGIENTIYEELDRLDSTLNHAGITIIEFVQGLAGGKFLKEERRWVFRPQNFVTLTIHAIRTSNITITLRGNPEEFAPLSQIELKQDRNGYSICKLESIMQLDAVLFHVRRAHKLWLLGKQRSQKRLRVVEN